MLSVNVPKAQLDAALKLLNPKQYQMALRSTVGKATAQGRTIVRTEGKSILNVKAATVNEAVTSFTRNEGSNPVGTIRISQKPLRLTAFIGTRISKRGGVTAKTRKDKTSNIHLKHGFAASMRSGHKGIFVRGKHLPTKGPNVGGYRKYKRKGKTYRGKLKMTARGIAGALTIAESFGPSVYAIVKSPVVMKRATDKIAGVMTKIFLGQFSRFGVRSPVI